MRKYIILLIVFVILGFCVGCRKEYETVVKDKVIKCSRKSTSQDNMETSLNYSIYYDGDYVTKTVSIEKVESSDNSILTAYMTAYQNVFEPYKNIDYYDNKVERNGNVVTSTTVINYLKVDVNKIIEIEGREDNIFDDDGRVKKDTLIDLYKKYGGKCE